MVPPNNLESQPLLLEHHVSLRVWALADAFNALLERELSAVGMTVASFRLIGELMREPAGLRLGELARRLRVKPPSVTAMVARLTEAGIVITTTDPDDARATRIKLAEGASLERGIEVLKRLDHVLEGRADEATLAKLDQSIALLREHLENKLGRSEP